MELCDILSQMYPDVAFSFKGEDLSTISGWPADRPKPTQADIDAYVAANPQPPTLEERVKQLEALIVQLTAAK